MNSLKKGICNFLCLIICPLINGQNEAVKFKLVDEQNSPIDGVYISILYKQEFWYSDTLGLVSIPAAELSMGDTLMFAHISFLKKQIPLSSINEDGVICMQSDTKELSEIVVKPLEISSLVEESIDRISEIYAQPFRPSLSVHASINVFDTNESTSLIYYKGTLLFSQPNVNKRPLVYKLTEIEKISDDAKKQLYPIRVSNFTEIMAIKRQGIIKNFKKYNFDKYQYIQYRGNEAVKINFYRQKGSFIQFGFLIIHEKTKAIVALQYVTQPMKNVMKSKVKGGILYTDLESHKVNITYALNTDNLYEFESGTYFVQYKNRLKNNSKSIITIVR